ncbi:MAG: cbb3-type cytochrome c oxidase subunit 3 [Candidatus Nitricoxidivorans perseverans]|uniref:Cbb3-type cytochrome c oxidase subunit 3 n=1 Tax=Candidatus Nitricoxidivorans perseverans TaxID=2975601 RepID=A0AA49FKK4_9PROT|nr:MAG: cbb3-type cytochrome c oxidase subunit 3 [Candidatus Nitricoxidivorans perseverans]
MDINDLRSIFTVLAFVMFVGIVWWAYSGRRKQAYEEAAQLPLNDNDDLPSIGCGGRAAGQSDK